MKTKKWLSIFIASIAIVILIAVCLLRVSTKKENTPNNDNLNVGDIANQKEYKGNIPDFTLEITGTYSGTITNEVVKEMEIPVYEFDAKVDNGWDKVTNHYRGIKLLDLFEKAGFQEYKSIEFMAHENKTVTYQKDEIDENLYLIFYKNRGNEDERNNLSLFALKNKQKFSVENLATIDFDNPQPVPQTSEEN